MKCKECANLYENNKCMAYYQAPVGKPNREHDKDCVKFKPIDGIPEQLTVPPMPKINGMSADAPTIQTPTGGKHSNIPYAMHLIPPEAMFAMSKILKQGAEKYETEPKPPNQENWRSISDREHINHALAHLYAYLAGDTQDEHLEHALCRVAFAVSVKESGIK